MVRMAAKIGAAARPSDRQAGAIGGSTCLSIADAPFTVCPPGSNANGAEIWKGVHVADSAQNYEGYCVKCKEKRHYEGEVRISESGRRMARGTCPVCGSTINRILGKA